MFNTKYLIQLHLSICENDEIDIYVPVDLDSETEDLYNRLNELGYNLFDSNDSFYNDICSKYTTNNNTDMLLIDRKKDIYANNNQTICQNGCEFKFYNSTIKMADCSCTIQEENQITTDINFIEVFKYQLIDSFYNALDYSNFLVMKCYKLLFSKEGLKTNIGSYILIIFFIIVIVFMIIFYVKDKNTIDYNIQTILKLKKFSIGKKKNKSNVINVKKQINSRNKNNVKNSESCKKLKEQTKSINKTNNKINNNSNCAKNNKKNIKNKINNNKDNSNNYKNNETNKKTIIKNNNKINYNKSILNRNKNNSKDNKNFSKNLNAIKNKINSATNKNKYEPPKNQPICLNINNQKNKNISNKNFIQSNNFLIINSRLPVNKINTTNKIYLPGKKQIKLKNNSNDMKINAANHQILKTVNNDSPIILNKKRSSKISSNLKNPNYNIKALNDHELNTLEYEIAIKMDKRSYIQYYWSLLKKKQLILFTFIPANDYNLMTLKLTLFVVSFSLYFIINGFFFTDDTMHKINTRNSSLIYRIPQILYSSIISVVINKILKYLSLSEITIINLKRAKKINSEIVSVKKQLLFRISIFFIVSMMLMAFFWYFIGCFCAVYENTQKILIKDTLVSYALSMLYPFGINLIPGLLRIPALKDKKKSKSMLYKISNILALF